MLKPNPAREIILSYQTQTVVYTLDPVRPDPGPLRAAAAVLRAGGLVAFPTETVYGLGANAFDAAAVARIFAAKGRPAHDPIIVHIHDLAQLHATALDVPALAFRLADAFWPGALTLVLRRSARIPANVSAGLDTVAVRMPSGIIARALLQTVDVPVAAPSANTFSRPSATTAAHVLEDLNGRVDIVLDGGPTAIGLESTVLDLTGGVPEVLRPGGVTVEALRQVAPDTRVRERYIGLEEAEAGRSPGLLIKHYAPRAQVLLYQGAPERVRAVMHRQAAERMGNGERVGVLATDDESAAFEHLGAVVVTLGAADDLAGMGARLFAALRLLDAQGVDVILVRAYTGAGLGAAIYDRLLRAAEGRVIQVE
jgi:L-threonylcarbamoyladenylate synthase